MAEEIIFRTKVDTGNTVSDLEKVDKELEEVNKEVQNIGQTAQKTSSQLQSGMKGTQKQTLSVKQELRQLKDRMSEIGNVGDPEFKRLAKRAGQLKDQMNNANASIKAMSSDFPKLQVGVQAMSGMANATGAFYAVSTLAGSENQELMKSMQKLMALQQLSTALTSTANLLSDESALGIKLRTIQTNALSASTAVYNKVLGNSTKGMKAFRLALIATGIGALIVGIGLLVANWEKLTDAIFGATDATKRQAKAQELSNEAREKASEKIGEEMSKIDTLVNTIKNENVTREARNQAFKELQEAYPEFLENLDAEKVTTEELNEAIENTVRLVELRAEAEALAQIKTEQYKAKTEENIKAQTGQNVTWWDSVKALGSVTKTIENANERTNESIKAKENEISVTNDLIQKNKEQQAELTKDYDKRKADEEAKKEADKAEAERQKKRDEAQKKADERRKKEEEARKKQLELEKTITELSIANIEDETARKLAEIAYRHDQERKQLVEKFGEDTELLVQLTEKQDRELEEFEDGLAEERRKKNQEKLQAQIDLEYQDDKARLEAKLISIQEDFEAEQALKLELAELERDQLLENEELTEGERLKIQAEYEKKREEINKSRVDNEKATNEAIISSRQALLGAVSDVVGQLSGLAQEGSATSKALALTELGINTAIGFANGLRIAQQGAISTGPGAPFAFPIFYATQIGAVLQAVQKAKSILGASPSVSAPSATGSSGGSVGGSAPSFGPGLSGNNTTDPQSLLNDVQETKPLVVLPVDSVTKIQKDSSKVKTISTVG